MREYEQNGKGHSVRSTACGTRYKTEFKVAFISQGGVGKFSVLNGVEKARGGGGSAAVFKDGQSCAKDMD